MTDLEQMSEAPLGDNILASIAETARDIVKATARVKEVEEELKLAKQRLRGLREELMPELMNQAGQQKLTTADGLEVSMRREFRHPASLEQKAFTWDWLRENGNGGIIKKSVTAAVGRLPDEELQKLVEMLSATGAAVAVKEDVSYQTLGSLVKGMLEEGADVPLEQMGGVVWDQANVKAK